jgi:hypothetical protein
MISGPQGKALADSLNITQEQLRARFLADPQGVGGMIQNFAAPTEATKNYNQARAQMKAQGMTDEQINAVMPPEMLALGGGQHSRLSRVRARPHARHSERSAIAAGTAGLSDLSGEQGGQGQVNGRPGQRPGRVAGQVRRPGRQDERGRADHEFGSERHRRGRHNSGSEGDPRQSDEESRCRVAPGVRRAWRTPFSRECNGSPS